MSGDNSNTDGRAFSATKATNEGRAVRKRDAVLAFIIASLFLLAAFWLRGQMPGEGTSRQGTEAMDLIFWARYGIVGTWVIGPPIYFFLDWSRRSVAMDGSERERVQHVHDLGRNVWVAFAVILAAILNVRWGLG